MMREEIEAYLDGAMSGEERAVMESRLANGGEGMLAEARADRAARLAAMQGYMPSEQESAALAARVLAACREEGVAPVGMIGVWLRRGAAVAAGLALVIGAFAAGRMTGTQTAGPVMAAQPEVIRVLYADEGGEPQMKEFANLDDANSFCRDMAAKHAEPVVVASGFDEEHPGSF